MADENKALVNMLPEHNKLESTDRFLGSGASEEFLVNLDDLASAVFEKIKSKFGAAAFLKVANNDTTTASGYVADARAVNALGKDVDELNSSSKKIFFQNAHDGFVEFGIRRYADGEIYVDDEVINSDVAIAYQRLHASDTVSFIIGSIVSTTDPIIWGKYVESNKLLVMKVSEGKYFGYRSI